MMFSGWTTLPAGPLQTNAPVDAARRSHVLCDRMSYRSRMTDTSRKVAAAAAQPSDHPSAQTADTVLSQAAASTDQTTGASAITATLTATTTSSQSGPWIPHEQESDDVNTITSETTLAAVIQRRTECPECSGSGRVLCSQCQGAGFLKRGGYNKKNPLNMTRIIGSKWTAMQTTLGWRHFTVTHQRKINRHHTYLLLQASCDHSAQLWVNSQTLRNRSVWAAGWLQMSEIKGLADDEQVQVVGHNKCQSCVGLGFKACVCCDGTGRAQVIVL